MDDCNKNNSIDRYFKEPIKKRRKLSIPDGDEKKGDDNSTSNNRQLDSFSNIDKLSYLGPSSIGSIDSLGDGKEVLDIISIKNEMNDLCNTEHGKRSLLSLYHKNMKSYARGGNHIYEMKINKKGKQVMVKKDGIFAHIKWAVPVSSGGGSKTRYHAIENMGVISSCAVAVQCWMEFKMAPQLGFTHVGNIGKAYRLYILIMYKTKLGFRFPDFVRFRGEPSFIKHVKGMLVKKNPDPDSIKLISWQCKRSNKACHSQVLAVILSAVLRYSL